MKQEIIGNHILFCGDYRELINSLTDKSIDYLFTDPPYFDRAGKLHFYHSSSYSSRGVKNTQYKPFEKWEVPNNEYYKKVLRKTKEQIIFGINYFSDFKNVPAGRIVWDKKKCTNLGFSDGEIALCSVINTVKFYRFRWDGMIQEHMDDKEIKYHPTQKPVKLISQIMKDFVKTKSLILDTHMGSGSFGIAAERNDCKYIGCEIDPHYYDIACMRLKEEIKQQKFNFE